jgi:hypothetical protein
VEELIKRMLDETEPRPLFNALEYRKALSYLLNDRDMWRAAWDRLALASTEVAK